MILIKIGVTLTTRARSGIIMHDHTVTPCHSLLMMIATSTVWTPPHESAWLWTTEETAGAVKWSPAPAEAIETGNGGQCGVMTSKLSNLRISYFPQSLSHPHSHIHTHRCTHVQAPPRLPFLYPLEVRVWYQPICSNHLRNPNSHTSTSPNPRSSFLFPPSVCHHIHNKTHCSEHGNGARREGQRDGSSELRRGKQQMWSPAWTPVWVIGVFFRTPIPLIIIQ